MNTLVREVFAVTSDTPIDKLEAIVNRLKNEKVEWGQSEEEAYEWAIADRDRHEEEYKRLEGLVNSGQTEYLEQCLNAYKEYERFFWLLDTLGDIRYFYFKAHEEEIVADYQPSEFEIVYARLVFGDTDPWTPM